MLIDWCYAFKTIPTGQHSDILLLEQLHVRFQNRQKARHTLKQITRWKQTALPQLLIQFGQLIDRILEFHYQTLVGVQLQSNQSHSPTSVR